MWLPDLACQIEGGKKVEEQSDEKDMGMSYVARMQKPSQPKGRI